MSSKTFHINLSINVGFGIVYIFYNTAFFWFFYFYFMRSSKKFNNNTMKCRMPATNSSVSRAEQVSPSRTFTERCIMVNVVPGLYFPQNKRV